MFIRVDVEVADGVADELEMLARMREMGNGDIRLRDLRREAWLQYVVGETKLILCVRYGNFSLSHDMVVYDYDDDDNAYFRLLLLTRQRTSESVRSESQATQ